MGLFGPTIIKEFEDREPGYYFQVLLTRPKDNKIPVNPTRMWETEKEAVNDLPYIVPKLVERDPKEKDSLIIRDASILTKYIYIAKVEKPSRIDIGYGKIDDIEQDTLQRCLTRNNIMFKVKLQNSLISASRNKVLNIAYIDMKDSLKNTEFTKKCVKFVFKEDGHSYDRFVSGLDDSLYVASYDAHIGIPNPRRNVPMLDKFYSELHDAVNAANNEILRMGFKLELTGDWDRGIIVLESLSSSIGESNIIYEEPSTLKIDGKPVDDEGEEDDNTNYAIENEPEEDTQEEPPTENPAPEEGQEEPPADEPVNEEEPAEDDAPTDYRIPDNAGEDDPTEDEGGEDPAPEGDEGGDENPPAEGGDDPTPEGDEEPTEGEDDAPTDYRVNTADAEDGEGGDEQPATDAGDTEEQPAEGEETEEGEDPEAKTQEDEIFSDMSPEQRRIQDEELKDNYIKLYNTIGDLIGRLNQIAVNNATREPIGFVQSQLNDLKQYVFKYLTEVYSTKTYIENNINYQQYLVILSNINNLLIQLNVKSTDID